MTLNDQDFLAQAPTQDPTQQVGLTQWKHEPTLADLKHDLTQATSSHEAHVGDLNRWEDIYNKKRIVSDKRKESKRGSTIEPQLIRKQAEWRCPALSEPFLTTSDLFKVDPVSHEDRERAQQNELILNNQFNYKIAKVRFIDNLIRTLVRQGTAIVRTGWEFQEDTIVKTVPQWEYQVAPPEYAEQLQPYMQMIQTEPDSFAQLDEALQETVRKTMEAGMPVIAQQVGEQEVKEKKTKVNRPTVEVCNSRNVYIDPTCEGDLDKAQFVIYSFESTLASLKQDGRYKNLDKIDLAGSSGNDPTHHSYSADPSFNFKDKARKKFTVYEYWGYRDIEGKGTTTALVGAWVGNTLIRLDENPYPDSKPPFVVVSYIPEEFSLYGIPDAELLEDNQKILGAVTRGAIDLLGKSANSQTGIAKGVLDATNRVRFRNGEDYEYNPNSNPQAQIFMHKYPEVPQSAMWLINMMNMDAEAISGVKAFSGGGITGQGLGDTAVSVRSVMDAVSKREMSILRRISEGILNIGRKILAMNAVFLSEEEVVRITNQEFVKVRTDDLAGTYDLRLTISTAESDEAKAKELAFMLQTMGNNLDPSMTKLILSEIARLRKMPDLAQQIKNHQPEPDPMQQQIQQLQAQKLQAEIALIQAQAQEASAKSQVQGAKVNVEEARAKNMQGDADLKTQKFVDNENGVSHQRDMEKQSLQSDANLQSQQLKQEAQAQTQQAQFDQGQQMMRDQHNTDLLKLHAEKSLNPSISKDGQD